MPRILLTTQPDDQCEGLLLKPLPHPAPPERTPHRLLLLLPLLHTLPLPTLPDRHPWVLRWGGQRIYDLPSCLSPTPWASCSFLFLQTCPWTCLSWERIRAVLDSPC